MSISFPPGSPITPSHPVYKKRKLSLPDILPLDINFPSPLITDFAELTISNKMPPPLLGKPDSPPPMVQPDRLPNLPDPEFVSTLRSLSPFPYKFNDAPSAIMPPSTHLGQGLSKAFKDKVSNFTAALILREGFQTEQIKQQTIGDCYLLAVFDALRHSPAVFTLLDQIKIKEILPADPEKDVHYIVRFPSGLTGELNASEIGRERYGKKPLQGPWIWQLLELAYAKATRSDRNQKRVNPFENDGRGATPFVVEGGKPTDALHEMFGGEKIEIYAEDPHPYDIYFPCTKTFIQEQEGYLKLVQWLSNAQHDPDHHYILGAGTPSKTETENTIDLVIHENGQLVISRFPRKHAFSIRSFNMKEGIVTVADPHDTAKKVYTLNMLDFCTVFSAVSGIRIPKNFEDVPTA